jgi:hypothetical protein
MEKDKGDIDSGCQSARSNPRRVDYWTVGIGEFENVTHSRHLSVYDKAAFWFWFGVAGRGNNYSSIVLKFCVTQLFYE